MRYLATFKEIKAITPITDNVDPKHVLPGMQTAHDLKMNAILGVAFVQSLLAQLATEVVIGSATNALPVLLETDTVHGFSTGDSIYIQGATGMEINGQFTITVTSTTEFELDGLDGTVLGTYNAGTGTAMRMPAENVAIMDLVRKTYAWWAYRDSIPFITAHTVNAGLMQMNGNARNISNDGGIQVSQSESKRYINQAETHAEAYQLQLVKYLSIHRQDYPLWIASCTIAGLDYRGDGYGRGYGQGTQPDIDGVARGKYYPTDQGFMGI